MDEVSKENHPRSVWFWLAVAWVAGSLPQWLFWSQGWNALGAALSMLGLPLAATIFAIGIKVRSALHNVLGGVIAFSTLAVFAGADEQLRVRVTLLANRSKYEHFVKSYEADPTVDLPLEIEVDASRGQPLFSFKQDVATCCEWKSIVYDPTGAVAKASEQITSDYPFGGRTVYASRISGPWYYCVVMP